MLRPGRFSSTFILSSAAFYFRASQRHRYLTVDLFFSLPPRYLHTPRAFSRSQKTAWPLKVMHAITSKQMQHSSCPESGLHLCFPWSRLSRQTLHTSQWKDLSLWILKWLKATLLNQKTNTLPLLYYWATSLCVACSNKTLYITGIHGLARQESLRTYLMG